MSKAELAAPAAGASSGREVRCCRYATRGWWGAPLPPLYPLHPLHPFRPLRPLRPLRTQVEKAASAEWKVLDADLKREIVERAMKLKEQTQQARHVTVVRSGRL